MTSATARATASVSITSQTYTSAPARESLVYAPAPPWLSVTEQIIRESVSPSGDAGDGQWIKPETAATASEFFEENADLMPGQPYLYGSDGDLVAEFKADRGSLTGIISGNFVILFADVDGTAIERRIFKGGDVREHLGQLIGMLGSGPNVESAA